MKKRFAVFAIMLALASCEYALKNTDKDDPEPAAKKVMLGNDKDANGCVTSAGYKWSVLRNECIRVLEEGYRLNRIEQLEGEETVYSAFVVFEENGNRAELYLPNAQGSIMLERAAEDAPYKSTDYTLQLKNGYSLLHNGFPEYAGATIEENQITGDDNEQS